MSVGFHSLLRRLVFSVEGKDYIRKSKDEGERLTRTFCSCLYSSLVAIPVYVKHNISFRDSSSLGRFEITVGPKQTMGKTVEGVMVTSQMPKGVLNMTLASSQGTHIFDPVTKVRGKREIRYYFFLIFFTFQQMKLSCSCLHEHFLEHCFSEGSSFSWGENFF